MNVLCINGLNIRTLIYLKSKVANEVSEMYQKCTKL